jgi:tight adherence protein B
MVLPAALFATSVLAALLFGAMGWAGERAARLMCRAGFTEVEPSQDGWIPRIREISHGRDAILAVALAVALALFGGRLAGPPGLIAGAVSGAAIPGIMRRRRAQRHAELVERQLAELAETTSLALRSGLSLGQAIAFSGQEMERPMRQAVEDLVARQRLGAGFEEAVELFADDIATDDARLFAVILSVHAKAGGNLAGALEEVTATIRHRIAVRKELRALSAQGRISGLILGSLPIAFSLVLAATRRAELVPVYRSPTGLALMAVGLLMEAMAFIWIRRLLRVNV